MNIEIKGLRCSYKNGKPVLKGADFTAEDGKVTVIAGRNGEGKTTLLRCLLGLLPSEGEMSVGGEDPRTWTARRRAQTMAYVPQKCNVSFDYPCIEMVMMGASSRLGTFQTPGRKEEEEAAGCLGAMGIGDLAHHRFWEISGGEQQLVLIARALMQRARTLLLDEPVANLDFGNQVRVMERLQDLSGRGYTVVMTSHNPEQAYLYAQSIAAFKDGRLLLQGPPRDVITEKTIREIYGIDAAVVSLLDDRVRVCVPKSIQQENTTRSVM